MTDYSRRYRTLETNLVHAGAPRPAFADAVVTPVFQSANYLMAAEEAYEDVRYVRLSNSPNHLTLHARLAAVEKGEAALVTASGMAAISTTLLAFVKSGDHVVVQKTLYGGTQTFVHRHLTDLGVSFDVIDAADPEGPAAWEKAVRDETRLIYLETISNPLMEVADLKAVAAFAKSRGIVTAIDNTFATPVNCRPREHGIDLVLHSATKYLNGHSDVAAGAVIGSEEHVSRIRRLLVHLGGSLDPHTCFLLERGMKTLALRVERQNRSALALARFLDGRAEVRRVCYPGLPTDPSHALARDLLDGYGGMLALYAGDAERAERFLERLTIPHHAASLGGAESLVVRPSRSSHLGLPRESREALGITDDLIRVSVGIENVDELIEDFAQALS